MEMVIGNSLYVPFKDSMDFYSPPSIKVESFKSTPESASNAGPVFFVESKPVVTLKVNASDVIVPETTPASKYHTEFFALMEEAEKTLNK